ncbi:TetR family transcriptional regulator, partial [Streptomyces sp. NPDC059515]|uniref:TetR family transcriptional regulator n=1 Tax=Streptomyces sp. NPDC059515 TaxID=3346854 RepID=UPI00369043AA
MTRMGLTTERLVRAGAEMADEIGFERTTPSELARRFGVKTASLYSHVRNARDLKARIALLALEELAERGGAAGGGRGRRGAPLRVAAAGRAYAPGP